MARTDCIPRLLLIALLAGCSASNGMELGEVPGDCDDANDCDDGVDCTDDVCMDGSCSNAPNDLNCDNGMFCDGAETCHLEDDCQAGVAPTDDDFVECTEDLCDEETDGFINSTVGISNVRVVNASQNLLTSVALGEQVQVAADLQDNNCGTETDFAYVVEFVDPLGELEVAFATGSLAPGQSFSPSLSWIPSARGTHQVIASVREDVDNTTPESWPRLAPRLSILVEVQ